MRALQQSAKNVGISLSSLNKISLPLKNNIDKFIVKVNYSPINPSDLGFLAGVYGRKPYTNFPKPMGFEGSGIIEEASESNKSLIGKKIAFYSDHEDES